VAVENASGPGERWVSGTVATLAGFVERAGFAGPVLVMIGEALCEKESGRFFEKKLRKKLLRL